MRNSLLLTLLLWAPLARAADTNQAPMIEIKATSATYQFKTGTAVFSGKVNVRDPDVTMTCQTLHATFSKNQATPAAGNTVRLAAGEDIDKIEALGAVVITSLSKKSKGTIGRADRAIYTASDRKMTLLGNRPNITRPNGERITADKFVYDIEAGTFTGEGNTETTFRRPNAQLFNTSTQPPK